MNRFAAHVHAVREARCPTCAGTGRVNSGRQEGMRYIKDPEDVGGGELFELVSFDPRVVDELWAAYRDRGDLSAPGLLTKLPGAQPGRHRVDHVLYETDALLLQGRFTPATKETP